MEFLKIDFDSNLVWRYDVLLSIDFIAIIFYIIKTCKDVNATFVNDICLDIIYVKLNFSCNGEIFSKPKWITLLTFNFIQPCDWHFIEHFKQMIWIVWCCNL
jgi:hypothetical protein